MELEIVDKPYDKEKGITVATKRYMTFKQFADDLKKYKKLGCTNMYLYDINAVN